MIKLTELVYAGDQNAMAEFPVWVVRAHITHMRIEHFFDTDRTGIYLGKTVIYVKEKPEDIL